MALECTSSVCEEFVTLLENREEYSKGLSDPEALRENKRTWFTPSTQYEVTVEDTVTDPGTVSKLFTRDSLDTAYTDWMSSGSGIRGDHMVLQYQYGLIAVQERTFRSRHITVPRILAHALISRQPIAKGVERDLLVANVSNLLETCGKSLKQKQG